MLEFKLDENFYGEGISKGISRGLLTYLQGELIVQEGMGIGSFAIQYNNRTYFCSIAKISEHESLDKVIYASYTIDMRLDWTFLQKSNSLLTSFLEIIASKYYMKSEFFQKPLLKIGTCLRHLLGVKTDFKKIESLGDIKAKYTIAESGIEVVVDCSALIQDYKFFVMNEIGGELFSRSIICGEEKNPPTGWQKIEKNLTQNEKSHMLKSPSLGLAFWMKEISLPENIESTLFWGREVSSGYNWAGFESELKCCSKGFKGYSYKIYFETV